MALRTRVNNAPASLQVTTAWTPNLSSTGAFLTTDQLSWTGVTGTNASVTMGGNINVGGIGGGVQIQSGQTTDVTINNGSLVTLTLGTLGIDMSSAGANLIIGPTNALALNANQNWNINTGRTLRVDSVVSGAFSLTMAGGGSVLMVGTNTYSGGTNLSNGTLFGNVSNATPGSSGSFGTGTLFLSGGIITSPDASTRTYGNAVSLSGTPQMGTNAGNGALTFTNTVTVASNTTLTVANSGATFSGQLTGSGTLTKSGAGDLVLTGSGNTNSGNVTLSAGNTQLASLNSGTPDQLNGVTTVTLAGGTIFYRGNTATTIGHALTGSTGGEVYVRNTSATGVTFSGSWSGLQRPVNIYADASEGGATAQTLTLSTNTATAFTYLLMNNQSSVTVNQTLKYTGTSTWTCGQNLLLFRLAAAGIRGILHNASSGNITWSGLVRNEVAFPVTFEIKNDSSGVTTISGNITQASSGALAVEKTGSGTATLTGNNAFTNPCNVLAGTLNANSATALGAASSTTAISVTSGATLSLGAALNYSSPGRTTTISGTGVSTAGALVHAYAGTANVGSISLGAAAYVRGTATGALSSTFALGTNRLTAGAASGVSFTLSGTLTSTSPAGLTVGGQASDTGTVIVSGTNTLPGALFVNHGTLSTQSAQALGVTGSALNATVAANATLSIGVLATYTGALTLNGSVVVAHSGSTNLGTITSNANTAYVRGTVLNAALASPFSVISDLTFGAAASASLALTGVINSSASNVLVNIGQQAADTGTVFFNANNTYAGTTTLAYGTAQVVTNQNGSISGPLGKSGTIRFTGGTLQYSATNQFDYSPRLDTAGSQQWKIDTNGQTVTFATVLQGASSSLTKSGTGTLLVTGTNTYTGNTSTGAGTLQAGNTQAFGTTGTVTLTASGATLQTLTTGGQNGKLTVAALTNSAGGIIKIGG